MPEYTHKYGVTLPIQLRDDQLELYCFLNPHLTVGSGMSKYRHLINASKIMLPEIKFHDWNRDQMRSLTQTEYAIREGPVIQRFVYWCGAAASGKTFTGAHYAFLWWLAAPEESSVILTSTSGTMAKVRIWPVIQELYHQYKRTFAERFKVDVSKVNCGNLVDSQRQLQLAKGDSKHAIAIYSVEEGEIAKTVAKIQGVHNRRILVVIDEATDTSEAVYKVIPNWEKGCVDLTVLLNFNPISRTLDPADRAAQPENGWESVGLKDLEWQAKGDRDLCLKPGVTLRFPGRESPNVRAGRTIYEFLYTWENHKMATYDPDKQHTIEYWKWDEAFPPPEGVSNTVMSETMIAKYDARGKHTFQGDVTNLSGLDPAFGGDRCIQQFAKMGRLANNQSSESGTPLPVAAGKMAIQLTDSTEIKKLATSKHEVDHQIAQAAIAEGKQRGVDPENSGSDATGIGRGVYSHLRSDWGECVRVEFNGKASDSAVSEDDLRPCSEVYGDQVTDLWFFCLRLLKGGQLKGISQKAIAQFCFRTYEIRGRKTWLESKEDFKRKYGSSPDEADAVAVVCEVARQKGIVPSAELAGGDTFQKIVRSLESIHDDESCEAEEMPQEEEYLEEESIW